MTWLLATFWNRRESRLIGLHISWNLFQGPVLGFPVSGNVADGSLMALEQRGDPIWSGGQFGPKAGLLGLLAELLLLAAFVFWGRQKSQLKRYATALCRFEKTSRVVGWPLVSDRGRVS